MEWIVRKWTLSHFIADPLHPHTGLLPPPSPSPCPVLQTRLWQALAVLSDFVRPPHIRPAVEGILGAIGGSQPPSVKQYLEGTVAGLLLKQVG